MEKEILLKNGLDLIYLSACALRGDSPDTQRLKAMDPDGVFLLAQAHSMTAVCAYGVERCDREDLQRWRNARLSAIRKNILLDAAREQILAHLEEAGCWYMPLKGVILKELYPKAGMRQMCDNDILIDPAFREHVREALCRMGYRATKVGKGNHDEYEKEPLYHFEMHVSLFSEAHTDAVFGYYRDVKDKLRKDPDNAFGYHFSDEDFYLYMLAHGHKHFINSGTGLRTLMDVYVYLKHKEASMDHSYLAGELEKLEITEYARSSERLAKKLFGETEEPLTQAETQQLLYYLSSGTYGTLENRVNNQFDTTVGSEKVTLWTKIRYLLKRCLPGKGYYSIVAPAAQKHKILIPFVALYRFFRAVFTKPKRIWNEIKYTWKK